MNVLFLTYNVAGRHFQTNQRMQKTNADLVVICLQECNTGGNYANEFINWLSSTPDCYFELIGQHCTPNNLFIHNILRSKLVKVLVFKRHIEVTSMSNYTQFGFLNLGWQIYNNQIALFSQIQLQSLKIDIIGVHFHSGSDYEINKTKKCENCQCQQRVMDWENVMKYYDNIPWVNKGHLVVFLGDTNFRMGLENTTYILNNKELQWDAKTIATMVQSEELNQNILKVVNESHDFKEVNAINFQPTYKVDDMSNFDYTRVPAWTDRILYRINRDIQIKWTDYDRISSGMMNSDHLAVKATADITLINRQAALHTRIKEHKQRIHT